MALAYNHEEVTPRELKPALLELDGISRADVVRTLVEQGFAVDTVTSRHRLEDVFLGLIEPDVS